ncbi:hypothetical protein SUGI_0900660 [Cryptomeria japonica]|nr:hypothetical protein SUGI_0900660 [Cryptomeria japonica]
MFEIGTEENSDVIHADQKLTWSGNAQKITKNSDVMERNTQKITENSDVMERNKLEPGKAEEVGIKKWQLIEGKILLPGWQHVAAKKMAL